MKKILLTLSFMGIAAISQAQLTPGLIAVGGTFEFSSESNKIKSGGNTIDGTTKTKFAIIPSVGYLISDKIEIGAGLGYDYTSEKTPDPSDKDKSTTNSTGKIVLAPYARYYKMMAGNVGLFGQGGIDFSAVSYGTEVKTASGTNKTSESGTEFAIRVRPGIIYFMNDKIAIEALWGGLGFETAGSDNWSSSTFKFAISPASVLFGFRYYITK